MNRGTIKIQKLELSETDTPEKVENLKEKMQKKFSKIDWENTSFEVWVDKENCILGAKIKTKEDAGLAMAVLECFANNLIDGQVVRRFFEFRNI